MKGSNKIEVYSKKQDTIVYEYTDINQINDEMLLMAKIESVLNERPKYITKDVENAIVKEFDKWFLLIVNGKELG